MPNLVTMGAMMQCVPFGAAPSSLIVIPKGIPVTAPAMLAATVMDFAPIVNIPPFGVCTSLANPTVAAATAAALGVLTPMPCIPATVGPWQPGALKVKIGAFAALSDTSICNCAYGGVIKITMPGQFITTVT
ncbi:DUF4280 domain-containing protein [Spirulina major CS-329]|jgi:hypothetical protein|uniref:DUF4280 domain-containing protein n=1 Tax=Spirulina TaxID=1154 RepID=UPI00232C8449|nr:MULTISPECIES: DUF4280 domain-containing protein [Spirulina]MDB9494118.1 DUF4280 domain-containing protein [Spirulina subsalsa CS-330]MDB9501454.1 DUF4280 domain-containing protein [Spirulina major CS-329]